MKKNIYLEEATELTKKQIETIKFKNGSKIQWCPSNDAKDGGRGKTPLNVRDFPPFDYFKSEYLNMPDQEYLKPITDK